MFILHDSANYARRDPAPGGAYGDLERLVGKTLGS